MVLMLVPTTAFAEENYTVTQNFKYGTPTYDGTDPQESPYQFVIPAGGNFGLATIEDCAPYELVGWKESVSGTVYQPYTEIQNLQSDLTFDAVYQVQGGLAVTVDGFEVGNTPADCTYSFESTIPGVEFSADDIQRFYWEKYEETSNRWDLVYETEAFEAGASYRISMNLDNKGLDMAPAVTVNGKTPYYCTIATSNGVPIQLQIACELGTPALTLTIDGPDVVCSWQDYEFTVTPPAGVTLDNEFGYDAGMKGSGADLTVDADGVGHGTVLTEWYDLNTGSFTLNAHGTTADGTPVTGSKTVEVSPEHIFVDGVCGCGVKEQYIVTYDPGEYGTGSIEAGVKTYDEPFTLSSETFKREGYVQTGWRDANYWMYFALGDTYYADEDVTLYPIWDEVIEIPFTTTVKQGGNVAPGKTVFNLQLIDSQGNDLSSGKVKVTASITTNGAGSYEGTMTITAPSEDILAMLSDGVFVKQVNAGEDGWIYDDKVWGLRYKGEIALAYDDEILPPSSMLIFPAILVPSENGSYYEIPDDAYAVDQMSFTNTYTKSVAKTTDSNSKNGTTTNMQTGDNSNLALWFVLLAVSAVAVIFTGVYSRRRRSS